MKSELATRVASGALLVMLALIFTIWHPASFALMVAVGAAIALQEWLRLTKARAFGWKLFGVVYIGSAVVGLVYLRSHSLPILLSLFAIVWGGDIAAYFVGRSFGKHKIAPSISPGKSWEGLAGSVVASAAIGGILGSVAPLPHMILGAVLAVIGLLGDLFESSLKRRAGVKDSGRLIPGHGGLLDRIDALLPCATVAAIAFAVRTA